MDALPYPSPLTQLSLAAPAYREGAGIAEVVKHWMAYLARHFAEGSYEVVICDDGSDDDTGEVLARLAGQYPALVVVTHVRNQGAAAALSDAIAKTRMAWVLLIDSDGQFPIENLKRFEAAWSDPPAPAFLGARLGKKDSAFARLGSWGSGQLCNLLFGTHLRDFNSAFKLVRGDLLRSLRLEAKGLNYSTEITARLLEQGIVLKEIVVDHQDRRTGRSSVRLLRGASHRFLFVSYLAAGRLLQTAGILRRPGREQ